jgi:hypothetical protein
MEEQIKQSRAIFVSASRNMAQSCADVKESFCLVAPWNKIILMTLIVI